MAYNFQNSLAIWNKMTKQQQKDYVDKNFNDPTYKRFAQDLLNYQKGNAGATTPNTSNMGNVWTPKTSITANGNNNVTAWGTKTSTNTAWSNGYNTGNYTGYRRTWDTFGDSWYSNEKTRYTGTNTTGSTGFSYDPNYKFWNLPSNMRFGNSAMWNGYLTTRNNQLAMAFFNEWRTDADSIYNYLMQYKDFAWFDEWGRRNTVNAIINRIWSLQNELNKQNTQRTQAENRGEIGIMWTENWATWDYWSNVNRVMKQSQWFDLEWMRRMYPEDYQDMYDYLAQMESVWNSTNPESRKELDARIQEIIGAWVGTGSDRSVLNRYEEALGTKFLDPDRVSKDMRDVLNLRTRGMTTDEIWRSLWMSPDQVNQLILLANWDRNSRAGDYYQLSDTTRKQVTEPYDIAKDRLKTERDIAIDRANQQADRLKEDFDIAMDRQKKQNDINSHNAHFLASKYWFAFSDRWLQWLQYIWEQAQNILDDLQRNYDRGNKDIADWISDIIRNWQWNNDDLIRESEDALRDAKNKYLSWMLWIQQKYWVLWQQAQALYAQWVQNFITQAEDIYDRALARQQQNFTNFVNNVANLNALAVNDFNMKQKLYEQFSTVAMSMNWTQAKQYAQDNWLDYNTIQAYQLQVAQNALNGVNSWAWMKFANELQQDISLWYSPLQAVQNVMKSQAYKDAYPMWWAWKITDKNWVPLEQYGMSGWVLYNKYTWQWQNLNQQWATWNAQFDKDGKLQTYTNGSWYLWDDGVFHQIGSTNNWSSDNSWTWVKLDDWRIMNNKTWEIRESNYAQSWLSNEQVVSWLQQFMSGKKKWDWWGQCGKFVNDYLQSLGLWRLFKDPITDKKAVINTEEWYVPKAWDIVVMDSPSSPKYWHVAIVVQNKNGVITTIESNGSKWDEKIFTRQFKPNSSKATKVYGYYTPQWEQITIASKAPEKKSSSSSKTEKATQGLDYYGTADVATLTKQLFGGNASDSDREMIMSLVQQWYAQGKTRKEILYDGAWYRINENADKWFADRLMSYMEKRTDPKEWLVWTYDLQSIASRINAWDWWGAIQNMESTMRQQFWDKSRSSEETAIALSEKLARLYSTFSKIEWKTGKLSMYDFITNYWWGKSNINNVLWLSDADAQAFASVATQIQNIYAEIRNQLAGTAVTENEQKWLEPMIPSLKDNSTVFKTKVKEALTNIYKDQNATRKYLWLPVFTNANQLWNWNSRASLYGKKDWKTTGNKI